MSAPPPTTTVVSARELLPVADLVQEWGDAVERDAETARPLGPLSRAGRRIVARRAAEMVGELLDVDLVPVLTRGWCLHERLVAAGYRTAADPAAQEVVEIGEHRVTSTHHPTVEVTVDGAVALTVPVDLTLTLDVHALVAVVRDGALVAAHPSTATLTAALTVEGVSLPPRTARVALPGMVDLGRGLRLVPVEVLAPRGGD